MSDVADSSTSFQYQITECHHFWFQIQLVGSMFEEECVMKIIFDFKHAKMSDLMKLMISYVEVFQLMDLIPIGFIIHLLNSLVTITPLSKKLAIILVKFLYCIDLNLIKKMPISLIEKFQLENFIQELILLQHHLIQPILN